MADQEEDQGITAYHGSPHEFERFDITKMGTGEGAQAYGPGLYFAEAEPTARQYRDSLSTKLLGNIGGQGKTDWDNPSHVAASWLKIYKTPEAAIDYLESLPEQHKTPVTKEAINLLQTKAALPETPSGHMYEVRINAHPDHLLDWDRPLSQQSDYVKEALNNVASDRMLKQDLRFKLRDMFDSDRKTVGDAFEHMSKVFGPKNSSMYFQKHGIKGVKYLDAVSRGQGEGSRNYVVFDDKDIDIKRRYALGGEVENREHLGFGGVGEGPERGSTGSAAGNSYGGGSGTTTSDGESYGPSNSSGRGDNGSGRDSSPSIGRSKGDNNGRDFTIGGPQGLTGAAAFGRPEQKTETYNLDNQPPMTVGARLGISRNVGTDYLKDALTPDISTANSPFAAGVPSYNQNELDAINDRMKAEQAALRIASMKRAAGDFPSVYEVPDAPTSTAKMYKIASGPTAEKSGMFGQPEFGATTFGTGIRSVGFPMDSGRQDQAHAGYAEQMAKNARESWLAANAEPENPRLGDLAAPTPSRPFEARTTTPEVQNGALTYSSSLKPGQTVRQNFEQAFADARAKNAKVFTWVNPVTGVQDIYTTALARKEGGRVPSLDNPNDWLAKSNVKNASKRVSGVASKNGKIKDQIGRDAIVKRANMLLSRKS